MRSESSQQMKFSKGWKFYFAKKRMYIATNAIFQFFFIFHLVEFFLLTPFIFDGHILSSKIENIWNVHRIRNSCSDVKRKIIDKIIYILHILNSYTYTYSSNSKWSMNTSSTPFIQGFLLCTYINENGSHSRDTLNRIIGNN